MFSMKSSDFSSGEGLIVLLADLVKGLQQIGIEPHIHLSSRHAKSLTKGFADNGVSSNQYILRSYDIAPAALIVNVSTRKATKRIRPSYLRQVRKGVLAKSVAWLSRANSLTILVLAPLGLLAAFLLFVIVIIKRFLSHAASYFRNQLGRRSSGSFDRASSALRHQFSEIRDAAFKVECERLAIILDKDANIEAVFAPFCWAGDALRLISKPKTVVFPDAVTSVYPTRFSGHTSKKDLEAFTGSVFNANSVVCYSEFTANEHLRRFYSVELGKTPVHVIPQGFFDLGSDSSNSATAPGLKLTFKNHFPGWCADIPQYDLDDIFYVVYPSVDRPHKNFLTLLRAIEFLLRKRHRNIKLITTSHSISNEVYEFIWRKRLFLDVLYAPSLDQNQLGVLISKARLVVHPSLSEGGDIFNFSRGVVGGTPVILSDIPVAREMFTRWDVPGAVFDPWLFHPTNFQRLADLIDSVLSEPTRFIEPQRRVYEQMRTYSYKAMAKRYYDIYSSATVSTITSQRGGVLQNGSPPPKLD